MKKWSIQKIRKTEKNKFGGNSSIAIKSNPKLTLIKGEQMGKKTEQNEKNTQIAEIWIMIKMATQLAGKKRSL